MKIFLGSMQVLLKYESPLTKGGIMLAGSFYPLNKGVAALCGGGILSKEQIINMAYLSLKKKWVMSRVINHIEDSFFQAYIYGIIFNK